MLCWQEPHSLALFQVDAHTRARKLLQQMDRSKNRGAEQHSHMLVLQATNAFRLCSFDVQLGCVWFENQVYCNGMIPFHWNGPVLFASAQPRPQAAGLLPYRASGLTPFAAMCLHCPLPACRRCTLSLAQGLLESWLRHWLHLYAILLCHVPVMCLAKCL